MTDSPQTVIDAPVRLIADNRVEFRAAALATIELAATVGGSVVVDLGTTTEIDSSGLGLLVLIEKRSREKGLTTVLLRPGSEVKHMLAVTKLEMLFTIQD